VKNGSFSPSFLLFWSFSHLSLLLSPYFIKKVQGPKNNKRGLFRYIGVGLRLRQFFHVMMLFQADFCFDDEPSPS